MKKYYLTGCLCLPFIFLMAQSGPVQWKVSAIKTADKAYAITVSGSVQKDWHVYAIHDNENGLEPLTIECENENISKEGDQREEQLTITIRDKIFNKSLSVYNVAFSFSQRIRISGTIPASVGITLRGYASNNDEFLPILETKELKLERGVERLSASIKLSGVNLQKPVASCGDESIKQVSLLTLFLKGMAGGFIALLMPCLFPMLPLTVSYFTNRSPKSKAVRHGIFYGLSIFAVYLLASVPFHLLIGVNAQIFNSIATNAWVNIGFFIIFLLFALSLFGLFELKLPAAISNKTGANSNISSLSGIFFMALTLVIVSFSCTGPILGTLLVGSLSKQGNAWELTAGMAGFGLALALPFAVFAMFPSWLSRLPKSGGWLDRVKKALAFIELALAFKFLSNADLVQHWGLLKREVFIGIWIIISFALGLYLTGAFDKTKPMMKVAHPKTKVRFIRPILATLCFLFAAYLFPGVTYTSYANLKLLSGFPPPLSYSIYGESNIEGKGLEPNVINDYDKALQLSKQTGRPLLIDFTGWACVNCRKMEELVWTNSSIAELIKEKFILVSLYVDDRAKLPVGKQFKYEDKEVTTLGDKWATFQSVNFGGVSQPMYVIVSPDEKLMNLPVGYTSPATYKDWLECGLNAFKTAVGPY